MTDDLIRHWAKDCAYEFKALHKTADIYHYLCRLSTIAIFLLAVLALAFSFREWINKALSAIAIILAVLLLIYQKEVEKTTDYREHADEYKTVYDKLEMLAKSGSGNIEQIRVELETLRRKNAGFRVSKIAHWWTQRVIRREMNLDWIEAQVEDSSS